MAEENQDGQEKTEEPTAKRLAQSKEEGQLLQSKEVMIQTISIFTSLMVQGIFHFRMAISH